MFSDAMTGASRAEGEQTVRRRLARLLTSAGDVLRGHRGRRLLRRSTTAVHLPPEPTRYFIGRKAELDELGHTLKRDGRAALAGLGGVGKTQLAAEFIRRHRREYPDGVFWLRGEVETTLIGDFATLAWTLGLEEREIADQAGLAEAVTAWLQEHDRWLLVIDDLDPSVLKILNQRLLRGGVRGHLLVTSRQQVWPAPLTVRPLPEIDATHLLLTRRQEGETKRARHTRPPSVPRRESPLPDSTASRTAAALATELGCLPLALEQAAAYMERTGESVDGYLALLRQGPDRLLAEESPLRGQMPVVKTWALSFDRIEITSPAAASLLRLCAFLASENVPVALLENPFLKPEESLRLVAVDRLACNRALSILLDYSMVARTGDRLTVHRLVQTVVRSWLTAEERRHWSHLAVRLVEATFPQDPESPSRRSECERLLAHAIVAIGHAMKEEASISETADLLYRVGRYAFRQGRFQDARLYLTEAVRSRELMFGPDHPKVGTALGRLGGVLRLQGDIESARAALERAMEIHMKAYGGDHPEVAADLGRLAFVLRDVGEFSVAQAHLERALHIYEGLATQDEVEIAVNLSRLGVVLRDVGDLQRARSVLSRAVAIHERILGPDHPDVAADLSRLAGVLQLVGELREARAALERALTVHRTAFGTVHHDVAVDLSRLGGVLRDLGDLPGAHAVLQKAISIHERVLGPHHPDLAVDLSRLGTVVHLQGNLWLARRLLERASKIHARVPGSAHPDAVTDLSRLGEVLRDQGDLRGARSRIEEAISSHRAAFGEDHPDVDVDLSRLASVLYLQGDLAGARAALERVAGHDVARGSYHPEAALALSRLGAVLCVQGEMATARAIVRRALTMFETTCGHDHREAMWLRTWLPPAADQLFPAGGPGCARHASGS